MRCGSMRNARHGSIRFTPGEMAEDLPVELDFSRLKFIGRGPKAIEACFAPQDRAAVGGAEGKC